MTALRALTFLLGLLMVASAASAKGLQHDWPVTDEFWGGTTLTAQGSAKGRGLTATIAEPSPIGDKTIPEVFDAEIEAEMKDRGTILKRTDLPRKALAGTWMLQTTIDYDDPERGKRIAVFIALAPEDAKSLSIVHADGPDDQKLMDHYATDIFVIAQNPAVAAKGNLARIAHNSTVTTTPKIRQATATPGKAPTALDGWKTKTYTDGIRYQPTFGKLALGSKTGYFEVLLFNPKPLNGMPLTTFLTDFVKDQEQHFPNIKVREYALTDGPNRAWDFIRNKSKNGTYLNISYLAIRTGDDSVRIIREIITDTHHDKRSAYAAGINVIYGAVVRETAPAYLMKEDASKTIDTMVKRIRTESRSDRRKRWKVAEASLRARFLDSIKTLPGEGIQMAQLHGVFMRRDYLKRAYGKGNPLYAIFVLLKDGTAYHNPTLPPNDLDVAASRRIERDQWFEWRRKGKIYEIRKDKTAPWKTLKGGLASPAPARTINFRGKFIRAWGDVLMGTAGFSQGGITLTGKGRFETSSTTVAGGPSIVAPSVPSATVSVSKGKGGTQTTTMSDVAPALINNTNRDPNGTDFTGQYALDGYTAEFLTDSGKLNRTLFFVPSKDAIYLRGKHYTPPKK